jgi:hypothetical protein
MRLKKISCLNKQPAIIQFRQMPSIVAAMVVLTGMVMAQVSSSATRTDEAGNHYGSISGKVISDEGAVPFASITLTPAGGGRVRGGAIRTTTTDEEGNFKIEGLRPIAWNLNASASGYVIETLLGETEQPFHRIGDNVTIRLVKGGVITGRVVNSYGEPMIAVRVTAQRVRGAEGQTTLGGSAAQTDDRGIYRLFGLTPGAYVVMAGASSGVAGGGFPGGPGFPGTNRNPYEGDAPTWYPSATRDTAVEVTVTGNGEISGVDIQYRGGKGRSISGKVTSSSGEARGFGPGFGSGGGAIITLTHAGTGAIVNRAFAMPRNDGSVFAFSSVADGEYEIIAQRGGPGDDDAMSLARRVTITGRDVSGLELALLPLASIAGKALMESVTANACETKRKPQLEEIVFALEREGGSDARQVATGGGRFGFRALFDEGSLIFAPERMGEVAVRSLPAGRYRIVPRLLDESLYIRAITLPGGVAKTAARTAASASLMDAGAAGINLKSGEKLKNLAITVASGAASINGKINAADGAFSQLRVHLIPTERERADDVLRYAETRIAGDGTFRLSNLAPGKYKLLTVRVSDKENTDAPKAWNAAERLKLRRLAEASTTLLELTSCQRVMNYELNAGTGR